VPEPYPREFRDDVVRVARNRGLGVTVEQIAEDFGLHPMTLFTWLRQADIDDGARSGAGRVESVSIPNRLAESEGEYSAYAGSGE
jgi:transposase-like protein